ncbi:MAG: helix-turn-helix domain-containing protein [Proteobacteria bacterium]|nr:helix-turn-helix domain-containing protein [Pseudomonadota bacterium]
MHKCPLCDGPVSGRLMFFKNECAFVDGDKVNLAPKESMLLKYMAYPVGRLVTVADGMEAIESTKTVLTSHISSLRAKLRKTNLIIKSRYRGGYYLEWVNDQN